MAEKINTKQMKPVGSSISLVLDNTTYVLTAQLKDQNGNNLGAPQIVDFPVESMVVSGTYNESTKEIVLTLQNGQTISFSVADLVSGLQTEITPENKLSVDLIDGLDIDALQAEINEIRTLPGVIDVVDSEDDLPTYSVSHQVVNGDVIIVRNYTGLVNDFTDTYADGEATAWRYNGGGWTCIGILGSDAINKLKEKTSELQQDIDDNAGKTAELDADLTMTKGQVLDIESLIPENATATNKLATAADVEIGGITEVKHDDSLVGLGTTAEPLKINIPVPSGGTSGQVLTKTENGPVWEDLPSDNNGLEGDYCCRYGIDDETKSGLPYIKAVGSKVVVIPAQLQVDMPGVPGLTINTADIEYEVQSTENCQLFLLDTPINGSRIIESTDVFFSETEPENGISTFAVWWDGSGTFKLKSNDTGNVWRSANAVRVVKCMLTDGALTRLCFTGCRVLNKQEYATKQQLADGLSVKADKSDLSIINNNIDSLYEEVGEKLDAASAASTYTTKAETNQIQQEVDLKTSCILRRW